MSRIFTIRGKSSLAGEHILYEGEDEFKRCMPGTPYKIWAKDWDIKTGDWVRADDGYIVKCLKVSEMKSNGKIILYKFPQGTFYYRFYGGSGKTRISKFCAQFAIDHMSNVNGSHGRERVEKEKGTYSKERFIGLLTAGVPLIQAYKATIGFFPVSITILKKRVVEAYMDPDVQVALRENFQPFLEKIKTDPEFSDEAMVEYIKGFMREVKAGSMTHLQSIIPLLRLMGKLPEEESKVAKLKKADGLEYAEIPPPQVGM